jgi:hypothetical protein
MADIKEFHCDAIAGVRLAEDGRHLWIGRNASLNPLASLDLDALDAIVDVPTLPYMARIFEGLGGRFYGGDGSDVVQMASPAGPIQQRITPSAGFPHNVGSQFALSPDRKTLYIADTFYIPGSIDTHSAVSRYDVSTETPVLIQRVEMPAPDVQFTLPPGGDSIYVRLGHLDGNAHRTHRTLCLSVEDLNVVKGELNYEGEAGSLTISPDGKLALQMIQLGDGGFFTTALLQVFDTTTFALRKTIVLGSAGRDEIGIRDAVLDASGTRIIAGTDFLVGLPGYQAIYSAELPALPVVRPKSLLNLSTRLKTQPGDNALIGGFIVSGNEPKKVALRGVGPSLPIEGKLLNPILELYASDGKLIARNDNWNEHRDEVLAAGIAPSNEYEAAIVAALQPGTYTAVLRGVTDSSGIALVEAYDLSSGSDSRLANISTRGRVETGDNAMIGGSSSAAISRRMWSYVQSDRPSRHSE